jgi:recombination protein RecA
VNQFINNTNKQFGAGTAIKAADIRQPPCITSGSLSLDVILGGGWKPNQWSEIRGKESAGKTALAFKTIAANQKTNPDFAALWVAAETYDSVQAEALGIDNSRVTVVPTQAMEFAFEMMIEGAASQEFDLIVLDSYPALIPDEEDEKAMDEFTTAMGARNFNKFIRKAGKATQRAADGNERSVTGLIINQYRDKIGGFAPRGIIPQTTPGGHGKDYFYYTIVKVARDDFISEKRPGVTDPVIVGQTIKLTTEKNKANAPRQTVSLDFYFREAPVLGFHRGAYDSAKDHFSMGVLFGVIQKAGVWYKYHGEQWQGKEKALAVIREDTVLQEEIYGDVLMASLSPELADRLVSEEEN